VAIPLPEGPPRPFARAHLVPIVVAAAALAVLATGIALAASVKPSYDDLMSSCAPACDPSAWHGLEQRANAGYALVGIGAAAAAADVALWIWQLARRRDRPVRANVANPLPGLAWSGLP
jgi:hypothetical protein